MHDTPVRMLAKGVIRSIVPLAKARRFFEARLRRRMTEETLAGHVQVWGWAEGGEWGWEPMLQRP
jgi:acetyl-CoA carboxylase/biotin carboxylase 1